MRILARSIGILLALALVGASLSSKAQEAQMVPILSNFYHWDHHWYIWLPGDPLYEAVEVMSKQRGGGTPPLVWVFFTERSGSKRQIHYLNDAQVASIWGAHFREIVFTMTGAQDQARGVYVSLSDAEGRPTTVNVDFTSDARLGTQGAGLTDQLGHGADYHLLLFFRERRALAPDTRVVRLGVDRAHPTAEDNHPVPSPWSAAYSKNIFVASLPFTERFVDFRGDANAGRGIIRFTTTEGTAIARLPDGSQIELASETDGRLKAYRHRQDSHLFEIGFETALSAQDLPSQTLTSIFRISLDDFRDIAAGTVSLSRDGSRIVLDWRFDKPDWAQSTAVRTICSFEPGNGERVTVRRVADR